MSAPKIVIASSPHVRGELSTPKIMQEVIWALIPAMVVSFIVFGVGAVWVTLVAVLSCMATEHLIQKYLLKQSNSLNDYSAILTGILLAFNLPSNLPWWMTMLGSVMAIGVGKMSFGGLGKNPFNPALVGRVFLLTSFPAQMTTWPTPAFFNLQIDGKTGATPLTLLKASLKGGIPLADMVAKMPSYENIFLGFMGGSLGEVSAIALTIGGLYLLFKRIISWHIPVSYLLTVFLFAGVMWLYNPQHYIDPLFHIMAGGLLLGAFFMATDMVTSPMTPKGMLLFGFGCGILTFLIRTWGGYPEGVSFAILIMNGLTPLINKFCKPKKFGMGQTR